VHCKGHRTGWAGQSTALHGEAKASHLSTDQKGGKTSEFAQMFSPTLKKVATKVATVAVLPR
jgi:hypothetical protein